MKITARQIKHLMDGFTKIQHERRIAAPKGSEALSKKHHSQTVGYDLTHAVDHLKHGLKHQRKLEKMKRR